jgi:hypothetical protein
MTVHAIDGVAGCGKTHWLMNKLTETLNQRPLAEGQKVLALTFMHGSRRRLAEKLRRSRGVGRSFDCTTVDSFARRLCHRWLSLAKELDLPVPIENDFSRICETASALLRRPEVLAWVCCAFPIVVVDEAQDLTIPRLGMLQALCTQAVVLIAGDEFQCLDADLRPNPYLAWVSTVCTPKSLTKVYRTNESDLLNAATNLRNGGFVRNSGKCGVFHTPTATLGAVFLANQIAWKSTHSVAVLTPSLKGGFAKKVVQSVGAGPCGKQKNGPYKVVWERRGHEEADELIARLGICVSGDDGAVIHQELAQRIRAQPITAAIREVTRWLEHQCHTLGRTEYTHEEIRESVRRCLERRSQMAPSHHQRLVAMTIHQAKNREFDGVVIIWPHQIAGDLEQKRRLLYNAITRARFWSITLVQGKSAQGTSPFEWKNASVEQK